MVTVLTLCPKFSYHVHKHNLCVMVAGLWVLITLLPTLIMNSKQKDQEISTQDYAGWGIWVLGFIFEAVADYQKSVFRANPENAVSSFAFNEFV